MTCRVTIFDGTDTVVLEEKLTGLTVGYERLNAGGSILRFLDGSAAVQERWSKEVIAVSGEGRLPSGLRERKPGGEGGLDYKQSLTVTIETGLGVDVYMCLSRGPSEDWDVYQGETSWSIVLEEA